MVGVALLLGNRLMSAPEDTGQDNSRQVFSSQDAGKLSEIKTGGKKEVPMAEYESYMNQNLKNILEQIKDVSEVSVMVSFSSTEKNIYQNNIKTQENQTVENDQKGGTRHVDEQNEDSQVVMIDNNGSKEPVVIGKEQPAVRGVIVVARGADRPSVRAEIMEAVATVLDIPTYKVKVLQKSE
ncbi:stage III sporulation protein AG [Sporolactobacillus sp. THM19-2]|nr:stage III sporulation protein AG [Sporolactobacillus sp. THM19-2]